ncbi:MAG: efflux transporter outer membrane subunit [Nitrospiria bacterium]
MKQPGFLKIFISLWVSFLTLVGCAVGPDFRRPDAPNVSGYTLAPVPKETLPAEAGNPQRFAPGQDIPAQWWTLFHSPDLDQTIRRAITDNPTLAAAKATLRQTEENRRAALGVALFPGIDANVSAQREQISGAAFGQPNAQFSPFNLYNASVSVSYNFNLFGAAQRELEALESQIDYDRFQLEAAYLTLTSNIVTNAVKEASFRAQVRATREIVTAQAKQLEIIEHQFELGSVSRSDVLAQQAQVAQTRATLPPLELRLAQNRHELAVLTGQLPGEAVLPEFELEGLQLPRELPVSLPSSLVRQRPDVLASESLLHTASAQLGVATASQFPQISLNAMYGSVATDPGNLFGAGTAVWSLGGGLLQPIFHGGELRAKRRAAAAAYDQAKARYRQSVLLAFQNVADVLRALEADGATLDAQGNALASSREALALTQKQFQAGAVSYLSLLNAERQYQQALVAYIQVQAARYADTAALFQSLGGGWWNRPPSTDSPIEEGKK